MDQEKSKYHQGNVLFICSIAEIQLNGNNVGISSFSIINKFLKRTQDNENLIVDFSFFTVRLAEIK